MSLGPSGPTTKITYEWQWHWRKVFGKKLRKVIKNNEILVTNVTEVIQQNKNLIQ